MAHYITNSLSLIIIINFIYHYFYIYLLLKGQKIILPYINIIKKIYNKIININIFVIIIIIIYIT